MAWDVPNADEDRNWQRQGKRDQAPVTSNRDDTRPDMLYPPTNTDETLLNFELIHLITRTIFGSLTDGPMENVVADANTLKHKLNELSPAVFDVHGNRRGGKGEYVVCLRPQFSGTPALSQVLPIATLEVWTRESSEAPQWRPVKRLILDHGRTNRPTF